MMLCGAAEQEKEKLRGRRNADGTQQHLPNEQALKLQRLLLLAVHHSINFYSILQSKRQRYEIKEIHLMKQPHRCLNDTDLLTLEDRSVLNKHYSKKLKKISRDLGHDNARNSEAEGMLAVRSNICHRQYPADIVVPPLYEFCVTLQNKKQQYENVNRKRESFLHDIALLSQEELERNILCNHYFKELQIIRKRLHTLIQQENAENTVSEARQYQHASLPFIQAGTSGGLAAGLSDEKVRNVYDSDC